MKNSPKKTADSSADFWFLKFLRIFVLWILAIFWKVFYQQKKLDCNMPIIIIFTWVQTSRGRTATPCYALHSKKIKLTPFNYIFLRENFLFWRWCTTMYIYHNNLINFIVFKSEAFRSIVPSLTDSSFRQSRHISIALSFQTFQNHFFNSLVPSKKGSNSIIITRKLVFPFKT